MKDNFQTRIRMALGIAGKYGTNDGAHHKMWVIDQMVRILSEDQYKDFIRLFCNGIDGPDTYKWDEGVAS